jgi:hypothetical protein
MKVLIYAVMTYDCIDRGELRSVTADKQEAETIKELCDTEEDIAYTIIRPFTVLLSSQAQTGVDNGTSEKDESKTNI